MRNQMVYLCQSILSIHLLCIWALSSNKCLYHHTVKLVSYIHLLYFCHKHNDILKFRKVLNLPSHIRSIYNLLPHCATLKIILQHSIPTQSTSCKLKYETKELGREQVYIRLHMFSKLLIC
jgi:hypothetical protein